MANVEHASLTGSALHEPKGVATANSGQVYVADGSGSGNWSSITATTPVGAITDFAGSTAPAGWLLCYGQAVSRTVYSELYAVVGTTYGSGNGSTTFNLPDVRGRTTYGKDNMGGSSAGRLTSAGGLIGTTLGLAGGGEAVPVTQSHLPNYTLPNTLAVSSVAAASNVGSSVTLGTVSGLQGGGGNAALSNCILNLQSNLIFSSISGSVTSGGSGQPLATVSPGIIFNKIIFTNV